jgi:aminopeptidase N
MTSRPKTTATATLLCVLAYLVLSGQAGASSFRHSISAVVSPKDRSLHATDSIYVSQEALDAGKIGFLLNKNLTVKSVSSPITIAKWYAQDDVDPALFKANPDSEDRETVKRSRGVFVEFGEVPAGAGPFPIVIAYSGVVYDSLKAPAKSYAKGFETTTGLIDEPGVFLSNESVWYPFQFDRLFSFRLKVEVPAGWKAVSQGDLASESAEANRVIDVWRETNPGPELYLVAGKYVRHDDEYQGIKIMTYTFEPADSLCKVYIDATKRYLAMYEGLVGKYPFAKFALVENFWQTGYGMPSFTLLGSKVIRLPFIVNTSYGHEILHNWWGNSVYVKYEEGNWCEGLTTYVADYRYKEMMSPDAARDYRHTTLVGFNDYVTERKDFPLSTFLERSDAATQSVGYGKSLMVYHMLRRSVGDSLFWDGLRAFYAQYKFKMASWSDLATVFSRTSGQNLAWFFDQWVKRAGAPSVRLSNVDYAVRSGTGVVSFTLAQDAPPFIVDLPVRIKTTHGSEDFTVRLVGEDSTYSIETRSRPLALAVDPDFDVFRRLYLQEIPITIGAVFAQDSLPVILGAGESAETKTAFKEIAGAWGLGANVFEDGPEIATFASTRQVWFMGRGETLKQVLAPLRGQIEITEDTVRIGDSTYALKGNTLVCAVRNPHDETRGIGIVLTQDVQALRGLTSRLPHYGAYSYLVFEKDKPIAKGVWEERKSPLTVDFNER